MEVGIVGTGDGVVVEVGPGVGMSVEVANAGLMIGVRATVVAGVD